MRRGAQGQCSHSEYSVEKNRGLHIVIDTIAHSQQRYSTVGDWQIDKAGMQWQILSPVI